MEKVVKYKIIPELHLVIEYFKGVIEIKDLVDIKKKEANDPLFNPEYRFLMLVNEVETKISDEEIRWFYNLIKNEINVIGDRYTAIITETPAQVAISLLFQTIAKELPVKYQVVSSVEAGVEWVGIEKEKLESILGQIEELKVS